MSNEQLTWERIDPDSLGNALRTLAASLDVEAQEDGTVDRLRGLALRADVTEGRARNAVAQVLQMDERLKNVRSIADGIDAEASDSGNGRLYEQAMDHVALIRAALAGDENELARLQGDS